MQRLFRLFRCRNWLKSRGNNLSDAIFSFFEDHELFQDGIASRITLHELCTTLLMIWFSLVLPLDICNIQSIDKMKTLEADVLKTKLSFVVFKERRHFKYV